MRLCKVSAAAIVLGCACVGEGYAQSNPCPTYRIVDLGIPVDSNGTPFACDLVHHHGVKALGLNKRGAVAGLDLCTTAGGTEQSSRPYYWLPDPLYGFAGERATLLPLDQIPNGGVNDISDLSAAGVAVAVGWQGAAAIPSGDAVAWELDAGVVSKFVLTATTVEALGADDSVAYSFSNLTLPRIVGRTIPAGSSLSAAFLFPPIPPDVGVTELETNFAFLGNTAFDISTAASVNDAVIAGQNLCMPQIEVCANGACVHVAGPIAWDGPDDDVGLGLAAGFTAIEGEARGTNDAGQLAGWADELTGTDECGARALFWEEADSGEVPTNLGAVGPLGSDPTRQSKANALSDGSQRRVVGLDSANNIALMWTLVNGALPNDPASWQLCDDLTSYVIPCAWGTLTPPDFGWTDLVEATDIETVTFNGCTRDWVVGFGSKVVPDPSGPAVNCDQTPGAVVERFRAFVLIPIGDCPVDTNCDNVVNVQDLTRVILDWGPCCTEGKMCLGDVNGDCVVNAADQQLVRDSWGIPDCTAGAAASSSAPAQVGVIMELFMADPTPQMQQVCSVLLGAFGGP